MNTCETCRNYMASPLQEPCESCHWDGVIGHDPSNWKGPTNADRIRAMTDEELAETMLDCFAAFYEVEWSKKDILDWLKREGET